MHFVVIGVHSPEVCPSSNAATRALLFEIAPQIPGMAERHGIGLVAGPFVNREHTTVMVVETERAADLDAFLMESRLPQWNQVRILPSITMEEALKEMQDLPLLF
jgi:hypothetical protein